MLSLSERTKEILTPHADKPRWHEAWKVTRGHFRTLRRLDYGSRSHPSCRQIPTLRERILEPGTDAADIEQEKS